MLAVFALLSAGAAEVIDRIAVTVDRSVITETEILRQIRITALLNGNKPDFSPENKRETADRLIEQTLIRREITTSRYALVNDTQWEERHKEFRARFKNEAGYREALARYRLTEAEVQDAFRWQSTLLNFIDVRFRPGIQVPEQDLRDYYQTELVPKAATTGSKLTFEDVRADIEQILTQQRVDSALDRWLGQTRTQIQIRYKQEAFR